MPTPILSRELAQEAVDAVDKHGSIAAAVRHLGMTRGKMEGRLRTAADIYKILPKAPVKASPTPTPRVEDASIDRLHAIRERMSGAVSNEAADERLTTRKFGPSDARHIGTRHIVIPDGQVKPNVPMQHWSWIGNYIADKKPDRVINIGDFADMPSLSIYDKGKLPFEGRRYVDDIEAVHKAQAMLMDPIRAEMARTPSWRPQFDFTLGNHEYRILRTVDNNPEFEGKFMLHDLGLEEAGWTVHEFLKVVKIDGIEYSHYFTSGPKGLPVASARALLLARNSSATMGHVQDTDISMHKKTGMMGMFCGTCYLHDEPYLGNQGNSQRRQIVVKNEVRDGVYDPMFVSLAYLQKKYS